MALRFICKSCDSEIVTQWVWQGVGNYIECQKCNYNNVIPKHAIQVGIAIPKLYEIEHFSDWEPVFDNDIANELRDYVYYNIPKGKLETYEKIYKWIADENIEIKQVGLHYWKEYYLKDSMNDDDWKLVYLNCIKVAQHWFVKKQGLENAFSFISYFYSTKEKIKEYKHELCRFYKKHDYYVDYLRQIESMYGDMLLQLGFKPNNYGIEELNNLGCHFVKLGIGSDYINFFMEKNSLTKSMYKNSASYGVYYHYSIILGTEGNSKLLEFLKRTAKKMDDDTYLKNYQLIEDLIKKEEKKYAQ